MSVETVNDHVLIPNGADWRFSPNWSRAWQPAIVNAVTGKESRASLRSQPRVTLEYQLTTESIAATQELDHRVRAAVKLGLGCCPYFGRGGRLAIAADAGEVSVQVNDAWPWQPGDYFFCGDENGSDAQLVEAAVLDAGVWTLTLDDVLAFDHAAGALAWPLLFGKFSLPKLPVLTTRAGEFVVSIGELTSGRSAQIGEVIPDAGAGIGHMIIGSTFIIA
jgi:hypothetical protein